MDSNTINHCRSVEGLEASRRVGWAKLYDALEEVEDLRGQVAALRAELGALADSVLEERNLEAFAHAWRIRTLLNATDGYQN